MADPGDQILLHAVGIEFREGGNTIWVHGNHGTILRIQCTGKISSTCCASPGPHADVRVQGDITICLPDSEEADEEVENVH